MQARPKLSCGVRPCLSVCLSRLYILSKRIIFSHHSSFSIRNVMAIFRRGPPNGGIECRRCRQKSRFSTNIWLSDRWLLQCETICDGERPCNLPLRPPRISDLVYHDQHGRPRRREENRFELYAGVNLKPNVHSTYCVFWSYWQTRSIARPDGDSRATCNSYRPTYRH